MAAIQALFWISVACVFWVYAGYPVFLYILYQFRSRNAPAVADEPLPTVSVIIAAYNEEVTIARRIENLFTSDYPSDKMEVIVGCDGSTDATASIASRYAGSNLRVIHFRENRGKTSVQNDCVAMARHDVLIFTDAACQLNQDSLSHLVKPFSTPDVGCVAGRLAYVSEYDNSIEISQGVYWRYELVLRKLEGAIGSMIGLDGPLYAIRRELYVPLDATSISDLIEPLAIRARGRRVVFATEAVVYEQATPSAQAEFATRSRIVLRGLLGVWKSRSLFPPLKRPWLFFQVISHKVLRWTAWLPLLVQLGAAFWLAAGLSFYAAVTAANMVLILAAIAGFVLERRGWTIRMLCVPSYFMLVNAAAASACISFARGKRQTTWTPLRTCSDARPANAREVQSPVAASNLPDDADRLKS